MDTVPSKTRSIINLLKTRLQHPVWIARRSRDWSIIWTRKVFSRMWMQPCRAVHRKASTLEGPKCMSQVQPTTSLISRTLPLQNSRRPILEQIPPRQLMLWWVMKRRHPLLEAQLELVVLQKYQAIPFQSYPSKILEKISTFWIGNNTNCQPVERRHIWMMS